MYGNGAVQNRELETATPPIEPISSVHQNTQNILIDANSALSSLLSKVRGSQPEQGKAGLEKVPERHLMADARSLRDLAGSIFEKAQELHRYIGHDK